MSTRINIIIFVLAVSCGTLVANLYYAQPIIEFIASDLQLSESTSGLLTTLTQVGYGVGLFFIVPMGDLFKSKKIILVLMCLLMISLVGMLTVTNAFAFMSFVTVVGMSACAAQMLVPIASKIVKPDQIGKYVGKVMNGLLIGIMLARPLSIALTNWLGWQMIFSVSLILLTIIFILLAKFLPDNPVISTEKMTYPSLIASMGKLFIHTRPLQQRSFYHACLFATFSLYWTVVPIWLRELNYTNVEIALIGFVAIAGAFLTPTIGKFADKGHLFLLTNVSMLLVIISIALLFFIKDHSWTSILLLIVSGVCIDIGVAGNLVVGQKVIFSLNAAIRNRLNGLYMATFFLGGAFGSWIGSYTYYTMNITNSFAIGIALPCIALVMHLCQYTSLFKRKKAMNAK